MLKLIKNIFDPKAYERDRSDSAATASVTGIIITPSKSRRFSENSKVTRAKAKTAARMKLERILEKTAKR